MGPYIGGSYYGQGHGIYSDQPYMNQNYQEAWNRPDQPRLPFLATLNLPNLLRLTNDPVSHNSPWPAVPTKFPSDIPSSKVSLVKILVSMSPLSTFGALPIPYMMIPFI